MAGTGVILAKNLYIEPNHYYLKGNLDIPNSGDFINATEKFYYVKPDLDSLTLAKYKGKVLYLEFWYSSCSPCLNKMPMIRRMREAYKKRSDFVTVGIIDGKIDDINAFKQISAKYSDVFDVSLIADEVLISKLHKMLGVSSYPLELIIDKTGRIRSLHLGYRESVNNYYYKKTVATINTLLHEK